MKTKSHEIAPGHTTADWRKLKLDPNKPDAADWKKAVRIFDARIRGRFFAPVDQLIRFEENLKKKTFGFAILAVDCLVIETLQGFRDGVVNHDRQSKKLFTKFLLEWDLFKGCIPPGTDKADLAERVYGDCRCALLHSGSTGDKLTVGINGDAFAFKCESELRINRVLLHEALKREFEAYLRQLLAPEARTLRINFKIKMDAIAGVA